ncbi:MAG: arylsulfatase [Labilithrix sp.]|nr:arylsulfatase [Labilithrix sp.]
MKHLRTGVAVVGVATAISAACHSASDGTADQDAPIDTARKPNIVFIMADDVGWFNIGAYHQGMMAGRTPHIDRLAAEGMRFTDYYAEPSCTAGRANFITGELPIRTGLTTVGQAGAELGIPDQAVTIATALKSMGYATGQFGKNHLGDLNRYLPTVHGFDEFFGYLYHLDAMEDPYWHSYPQDLKDKVGPRNVLHSWALERDDETEEPRWGKVGKQRIEDAGPLPPERMKTVDKEILDHSVAFMRQSKEAGKPFFLYLNPTRMHVYTHLAKDYANKRTSENSWYTYEAGMAQLDDIVGSVVDEVEKLGVADDTILVFTTDNGAEVFTWPDGGLTPFAGAKGTVLEGGMRVPMIVKWPGRVPAGKVENAVMSGLDWFPTLVSAAGNPNIAEELRRGKKLGDTTYKVHLDGYDQTDLLTGAGPTKRDKVWYFAEGSIGAVRIGDWKFRFIDQPGGWGGPTEQLKVPSISNLRLDPFERTDPKNAPPALMDFIGHEFWRFVFVQQEVETFAKTFEEFPPMQRGAAFNVDKIKDQVRAAIASSASD